MQRASVVVEETDVVIALLFLYNAFQPHAFFFFYFERVSPG